jgi:hypothetical protein
VNLGHCGFLNVSADPLSYGTEQEPLWKCSFYGSQYEFKLKWTFSVLNGEVWGN